MAVSKLKNLSQLRRSWRLRVVKAFAEALIPMVVATVLVSIIIANWMSPLLLQKSSFLSWLASQSTLIVFTVILPLAFLLSIPLLITSAGPFPTQGHLELNKSIRRAAGMSDDVDEGDDCK